MKHPPPRRIKRTVRHGQRLTPDHKIAEFLQIPAQKTVAWLKNILSNGQALDEKDIFKLKQVLIAAKRLVLENLEEKEKLRLQLEKAEDEGEKLGFSVEEIRGMNAAAFLIDNESWLNDFIERAKEKINGKNRRD